MTSDSSTAADLLEFYDDLTDKQTELLQWVADGNRPATALHLHPSQTNAHRAFRNLKANAAKRGFAPEYDMTHQVPDGYNVKGVSTYYNKEGKPTGQWVKSTADQAARDAAVQSAIEAVTSEIPRVAALPAPKETSNDLVNLYTLTDCHVGMLAWHKEGGEDWDLSIAEKTLVDSFAAMIAGAPSASVAIVNQLGDWMHYDSMQAVTPISGHSLDSDGRTAKMIETSIRVLRKIIDMALIKHDTVHCVMAEGNHDIVSSIWLRKLFKALYENEPRFTIDDSELPYYVYQHGQTMLAFHHGHLKKPDGMPLLFAAQFPVIWGQTVKRYAHCGHQHHVDEKEHSGMTVTQHPTLAARDAYAARGGWISERAATAITYHKSFGKVATNTVCPEMLEAA